jgi:Arc/MetJ-type ribon-helix-helix transcriptional regulator
VVRAPERHRVIIPNGTILLRAESVARTEQEQAYQVAVRLTRVEYERIQEMIRAGLFRSAADFAREAVRDKLREAEPLSVRDIPRRDIEALIDSYLAKHPGAHFASEIAEALGLDFRPALEAVKRMIEKGRIRRSKRAMK